MSASIVPLPIEGANLPPKASPTADGSQVTDFAQEVQVGLLGVLTGRYLLLIESPFLR